MPYFSMVWLSFLRGLPLGHLSIVIPKASNHLVKNSLDPMFSAKGCQIIEH